MQWTKMTSSQKATTERLRDELHQLGVETSKTAIAKEFDAAMSWKRGEATLADLCEALGADMPAASEEPEPAEDTAEPAGDATQTAWVSVYDQEAPGVDGVDVGHVSHLLPMDQVLAWAGEHGYGTDDPDVYLLVSVDPDAPVGPAVDTMTVQVPAVAAAEIAGEVYAATHPEPMGRDDVAELIGVTPDTVSRYMTASKPRGFYADRPFPAPSGVIGRSPWWAAERAPEILVWAASRPGRTGRPPKTPRQGAARGERHPGCEPPGGHVRSRQAEEEPIMTMLEARGAEYVTAWPDAIAARLGLSVEYVARALGEVTGQEVHQFAFYGTGAREPHPVVAALEPEQAKAVIERVRQIRAEIRAHERTHCRGCGLPLRGGACEECV